MNAPQSNDQRNEPAYPSQPLDGIGHPACAPNIGLSKRELFAAMAMQGWFAGCRNAYSEFTDPLNAPPIIAQACLRAADALLSALEHVKP